MIIPTANELIAEWVKPETCLFSDSAQCNGNQPDNDASDNCPSPCHPEPVLSKTLHS